MDKIKSLQGLRAIAFILILVSHCGLTFGGLGEWAVSVFFVLSGFLMTYSYMGKNKTPNGTFKFAWGKIKDLYVLHIFTMLCVVFYNFFSYSHIEPTLFVEILLHVCILQPWVPLENYHASLNGPSWYLSACFFHYLCFPFLLKALRKIKNKKSSILFLFGCIVGQIAISFIAYLFGNTDYQAPFSVKWITYFLPLTRMLDFGAGCLLGWIFLHSPKKSNFLRNSIFEFLIWLSIAALLFLYNTNTFFSSEIIKYTLLFIIPNVFLVWFVAKENSIFSRLLSSNVFVWVGNLSPQGFLIHSVIITYLQYIYVAFIGPPPVYIVIAFSLIGTLLSAIIWNYLYKKTKNLFHKKEHHTSEQKE